MENYFTIESALLEEKNGNLETWLHNFLLDEGSNIALSDGLKIEERTFHGIFLIPLNKINRCCGPEENMKFKVPVDGFEYRIEKMRTRYHNGWSIPPLLLNFSEKGFELNDGNHRFEMLKRENIQEYYFIVWTTGSKDKDEFMKILKNGGI